MKLEGEEEREQETGSMFVLFLSLMVKEVLNSSRYILGDHGHLFHVALELVVDGHRLELEDVMGWRVGAGEGRGVGR